MDKVIIGVVAKHIQEDIVRTNSLVRDEMKQAIFDNGAIAIGILSPSSEILFNGDLWYEDEKKLDKLNIIEQIKLCDGIILQGGKNSESYEPFIARYCYENDIPCLGVCAGQNNIVRALGGTMFEVSDLEQHYRPDDNYVHTIKVIDKNSKFYALINQENIFVNSRHKKTIATHPMLNVIAISDDDCKEVVESKEKLFYMGVRFHPESLYKKDQNMNKIFKGFIEACRLKNKV